HNLKNIDVNIPRERFTVITGVSGSGKSTLAFDILFAEGQRRYLESLNAYARQFVQPASRPDVDAIFGIPPTVAIEQRASRGGRKSTVATLTEVYHFLRLLYVKLGTQYCPDHDAPIAPQSEEAIATKLLREYAGHHLALLAPLVVARKGYYTDLAKWAARKGFAELRVDGAMLPTARWPDLDPRLFSFNSKHGWCATCYGTGLKLRGFDADQTGEEIWWNEWYGDDEHVCPECHGRRLNAQALAVRFREQSIADLTRLAVGE